MRDRTLAVILTVVAVILLACPGLAVLCLGLTNFLVYFGFDYHYLGVSPNFATTIGVIGVCIGVFLIVIAIVASFFILRKRPEPPPTIPEGPLPPITPEKPPSPPGSDEPLPPPI